MKTSSVHTGIRTLAAATFATLLLAGVPAMAADADAPAPDAAGPAMTGPAMTGPATTAAAAPAASTSAAPHHDKDVEARIKKLHDQLKITKDEETQWSAVADAMRSNAAAASAAYKDREDKRGTMSAVDDIRSYQALTADRADGLKKLADAFAPLYAAMPEAQQKNADAVFAQKAEKKQKEEKKAASH